MQSEAKLSPDYVVFVSYGNDSVALLQWAFEKGLKNVSVVFTDTGWAADGWMERVEKAEVWVRDVLGFTPHRSNSVGFRELARQKKGIPTQQFQWCSFILKIEPGQLWIAEHDPHGKATCVVGVRREESQDRADWPEFQESSPNHGGRPLWAPFATWTEEQRNVLIERAGFAVLPHRSRECRCINSNREDMRRFTDDDWKAVAEVEAVVGKTFFRPKRHMGAVGSEEVRKWANSERGQYRPQMPMEDAVELEDAQIEFDFLVCKNTMEGGCGR